MAWPSLALRTETLKASDDVLGIRDVNGVTTTSAWRHILVPLTHCPLACLFIMTHGSDS